MPRYDIRNDGAGPYGIFYCDACGREFRSQPNIGNTIAQDIGRQTLGGLLRKVPIIGDAAASSLTGDDPRYSYKMDAGQLDDAWKQVQEHFRECPTCQRIVCLSDFDAQSGFCQEDSPRTQEIAESRGEQAGAALKGLASAFGLGDTFKQAGENFKQAMDAAQKAGDQMARCPQDGTLAAPGTKFCPNCGTAMIQPAAQCCPSCGQAVEGAKFCPNCGAKIEAAPQPAGKCPNCGAEPKGAKFCPECGTQQV
jgi:hypothetical protein